MQNNGLLYYPQEGFTGGLRFEYKYKKMIIFFAVDFVNFYTNTDSAESGMNSHHLYVGYGYKLKISNGFRLMPEVSIGINENQYEYKKRTTLQV